MLFLKRFTHLRQDDMLVQIVTGSSGASIGRTGHYTAKTLRLAIENEYHEYEMNSSRRVYKTVAGRQKSSG